VAHRTKKNGERKLEHTTKTTISIDTIDWFLYPTVVLKVESNRRGVMTQVDVRINS